MSDARPAEALAIVSRRVMYNALRTGDPAIEPEWENYPDIGEADWEAIKGVVDRFREGMLGVTDEAYFAAYEYLEGRVVDHD